MTLALPMPLTGPTRRQGGQWLRDALPIGTIRVRTKQRRGGGGNGQTAHVYRVRLIKIRLDGPKAGRWIHYARWWWEENIGKVPQGKRVAHANGDPLDDRPANYVLATPGDVAFICHEADPKMSARSFQKAHAACAAANRLRGLSNRARHFLPTRWYAVDFAAKRIINEPHRSRIRVYRSVGIVAHDWRRAVAAAVGSPIDPPNVALIRDALRGDEWIERAELVRRFEAARRLYGLGTPTRSAFIQALTQTRRQCALRRARRGTILYRIGPHRPDPASPFAAVRGSRLAEDPQFSEFQRENA